jgi:hypothetical protein
MSEYELGPEEALVNDANAWLLVQGLVKAAGRSGVGLRSHPMGPYDEHAGEMPPTGAPLRDWRPRKPFQAHLLGDPREGWGATLVEALVELQKAIKERPL